MPLTGDATQLRVEVSDQGRGFEWQWTCSAEQRGFGLWSIADRVQEAGGDFTVDTAPGRGSRFEMIFPSCSARGTGATPVATGRGPG